MWALVGRSVLAYFTRREQAELACSLLRQEGYDTVQLDEISRYASHGADRLHDPFTGRIDGMTEWSGDAGDAGPLINSDPAASGFGQGGAEAGIPAASWLVTVVTGEDGVNRAVQILEDAGGAV